MNQLYIPQNLYFDGFECSGMPNQKKEFDFQRIEKATVIVVLITF